VKRLGEWLRELKIRNRYSKFPEFLNYDLILKSIDIILDSEVASVLICCLSFLYSFAFIDNYFHQNIIVIRLTFVIRNLQGFPDDKRSYIVQYILEKHFYRFALHWHRDVRSFFLHIVVFCCYHKEDTIPISRK
jgi:hypothetical protein